ncbi:MAG: PEP-CTERM sorting domain-containing protein [Azonexus sp.]|jgi:hypothetical protein|uniref:PEP-CTERM sorting domain-containing protein n=1 Tax=Azonexus sp. TaxID=1872668 RepID=UPI0028246360|nr:PEP-CTERM sorting domain-containing protein [Azonexus sp.]MDR0777322.1 PEP-CTERM sorting domain-containing protein [Azonexus sp.]
MTHIFSKTLLASLLCMAAVSVSAAPILVKTVEQTNGRLTNSLTLPIQSGAANYWAGSLTLVIDDVHSVLAFCSDPWETTSNINQVYDTSSLDSVFGSTKSNFIRELYSEFYESTLEKTVAGSYAAAGFQLALWEIIADGDLVLDGTGLVRSNALTNPIIVGIANNMLSQLDGILGGELYDFTFYTNGMVNGQGDIEGYQDFLVVSKKPNNEVPEPASTLLLVTALGGGLLLRRRQK